MARRPDFLRLSPRNKFPKTLEGQGQVLSFQIKPINVKYTLLIENKLGIITGRGILYSKSNKINIMWIQPIVSLRLEDGNRVMISIIEIRKTNAIFEMIDDPG